MFCLCRTFLLSRSCSFVENFSQEVRSSFFQTRRGNSFLKCQNFPSRIIDVYVGKFPPNRKEGRRKPSSWRRKKQYRSCSGTRKQNKCITNNARQCSQRFSGRLLSFIRFKVRRNVRRYTCRRTRTVGPVPDEFFAGSAMSFSPRNLHGVSAKSSSVFCSLPPPPTPPPLPSTPEQSSRVI